MDKVKWRGDSKKQEREMERERERERAFSGYIIKIHHISNSVKTSSLKPIKNIYYQ